MIGKSSKNIIMKKIIPFLKNLPPVLFKVSVGGFILISVALYFQSCMTSFDAEKFHFNGVAGKCRSSHVVSDTIH